MYLIFTFREFKSIHKGKTAILHLRFGTEKNRRLGSKKARYNRAFRRRHLFCLHIMVRATGLEPACLTTYEPKSYVSANSTTPAYEQLVLIPAVIYFIRLPAGNQGGTEKAFPEVTSPKSRMSANSITGAHDAIIVSSPPRPVKCAFPLRRRLTNQAKFHIISARR